MNEILQDESSQELKGIKGAITEKSLETLEYVDEDKESEHIKDNHSMKICTRIVTELEEDVSKINKRISIKETQ